MNDVIHFNLDTVFMIIHKPITQGDYHINKCIIHSSSPLLDDGPVGNCSFHQHIRFIHKLPISPNSFKVLRCRSGVKPCIEAASSSQQKFDPSMECWSTSYAILSECDYTGEEIAGEHCASFLVCCQ